MPVYQGFLNETVAQKEERDYNAGDWHYLGEHHGQALIARLLRQYDIHPIRHAAFLRSIEAGLMVLELQHELSMERIYYMSYRLTVGIYRSKLENSTHFRDGVKVVHHG